MAEKLDWFENGKMVTHPADPTPSDSDTSYPKPLAAGEYTPPQTVEELNVLNDMLLAQNQITNRDGETFIDTMQSLKDAEEQAELTAVAEKETLDKIAEAQAETVSENLEYLVRGAVLRCRCGTHQRRLNLPECHGVYTQNHPLVHQLDCISGGPFSNIEAFGICNAEGNPSGEKILLKKEILDENGLATGASEDNEKGKPCTPVIIGTWMGANETAFIRENIPSAEDCEKPNAEGSYYPILTMHSFLVCKYGGLIEPRTSGQEYEATEKELCENCTDSENLHEHHQDSCPASNDTASGVPDAGAGTVPLPDNDAAENNGSEATPKPPPLPEMDQLPEADIQNKTHWCFATCAMMAAQSQGLSTAMQEGLTQYINYLAEDKENNRNYYSYGDIRAAKGVVGIYRPKNSSELKYYCDPGQEFAVAVSQCGGRVPTIDEIKSLSLGNNSGDAKQTLEYLTEKTVVSLGKRNSNYFLVALDTGDSNNSEHAKYAIDQSKVNEIQNLWQGVDSFIVDAYPENESGHSFTVRKISTDSDGNVAGLTLYDPMLGSNSEYSTEQLFVSKFECHAWKDPRMVKVEQIYG